MAACRRSAAHLVGRKVRADEGDAAAVQGEGDSHGALVSAHSQHAARDAGGAHLARVRLRAAAGMLGLQSGGLPGPSRGIPSPPLYSTL